MQFLKRRIRRWLEQWLAHLLRSNAILAALYVPESRAGRPAPVQHFDSPAIANPTSGALPVPPADLAMGYRRDSERYLESGAAVASLLKRLVVDHGRDVEPAAGVLDWGCTSGRVLRHFEDEATRCPVWGVDVDQPSISWAKAHLSPPFHFVTGTAYPHLPFRDGSFALVYGISVMTHLLHLRDLWLLEIRRILSPGGLAVLTIHDEATLQRYQDSSPPAWVPDDADLVDYARRDYTVLRGADWADSFTFFSRDHIRREWGGILEIVDFCEVPHSAHSAVVLRYPGLP